MTYSSNIQELTGAPGSDCRQLSARADPAGIPIEQPSRFELIINLAVAKSLDLKVPQTMLLRADKVIE